MTIGIGTGMYSAREASRLTGLSVHRVKGWILGYPHPDKSRPGAGPLVQRDPADGLALSFLDLIELLFVDSFLKHGVKMSHIRRAAKKATEISHRDHPFAIDRFETDGKTIFATLTAGGMRRKRVLGLVENQFNFDKVVSPLFKQIEHRDSGDAIRWWPLGRRRQIIVDPRIAFGAPVTKKDNVPVSAITAALAAGDSPKRVAKWFEIPLQDVKAAEEFERQLAA